MQLPLMGAWFCKTFSPWLMPPLYAATWLSFLRRTRPISGTQWEPSVEYLEQLLESYPTSLYPVLTLLLQSRAYATVDGGQVAQKLSVGMDKLSPEVSAISEENPASLSRATSAIDLYCLNNVIHQTDQRSEVMREAARVVRPGGLVLLTDNTAGWLDAIWTVRLAKGLGRTAVAHRLANDKLASSGQKLIPDFGWWASNLDDKWELLEARPFFSRAAMTAASLFESLNFKQGGPGPEWLTKRVTRNPVLKPLYRALIGGLARRLTELDDTLVERSGATSLMVVLRRTSC